MLPDWLREKLATPPEAGAGIHAWLFSCARQLHAHMPAEAIKAALQAATAGATRRVTPREIRDAVTNSRAVAWQGKSLTEARGAGMAPAGGISRGNECTDPGKTATGASDFRERWPRPDAVARRCRMASAAKGGVSSLYDLWEISPVRDEARTADDWLDWLFPDAEWLCLAEDHPATARSRRKEKWFFGPADKCGLIVPSPMTGPSGKGLDGEVTHRCLENTGPRRWLVLEFDSGTVDEQAALHWHLRAGALAANWPRLHLCTHSGGKSLHGWYGPCLGEESARELMAYAVSLGADPATWVRCQLVRLPGGLRREGVRQEVFYFDPKL